MFEITITILLGILGGVAVGTQASMAGEMSRRVGGTPTSFFIHLSGAILSGILLMIRGGEQLHNWRKLSWCMWGAGVFGVVLYLCLARTIPRLGAATAIVLLIIGQLGMGMLIDHFGFFGLPIRHLDGWRVMALILLITGGYLMVRC
ncbi:MAG TPA: DMT family transporter [Pyrinomonadaceae bacterium]|jgi:transporter family-2 protein